MIVFSDDYIKFESQDQLLKNTFLRKVRETCQLQEISLRGWSESRTPIEYLCAHFSGLLSENDKLILRQNLSEFKFSDQE